MWEDSFDREKENIEKIMADDQDLNLLAGQLRAAMRFGARPEFNQELRASLLAQFRQRETQPAGPNKTGWRGWQGFSTVTAWQKPFTALVVTALTVTGLVLMLGVSGPAAPPQIDATATPAVFEKPIDDFPRGLLGKGATEPEIIPITNEAKNQVGLIDTPDAKPFKNKRPFTSLSLNNNNSLLDKSLKEGPGPKPY